MEEIEKLREIERAEPEKLKERTRLRREKENVDEFEKFTVECPECKSHTLVRDYERAELVCSDCGLVIDGELTIEQMGQRIFEHILDAASGKPTKSELLGLGDNEFLPWHLGIVS